jgi:hypothetical protein
MFEKTLGKRLLWSIMEHKTIAIWKENGENALC